MKLGTYGFAGSQLRDVRKARGMTGAALAAALGVSRQAVSDYETGKKTPSPEIMVRICKKLRVPQEFLRSNYEWINKHLPQSPIFYRSLTSATKRAREGAEIRYKWVSHFFLTLANFVEFPNVNLPQFTVPQDPVELSWEEIEALASKTRRYWGLGDGPISNIVWLLENNGVIVSRYALEANGLDAFSQWAQDRPFIILGADKASAVRSRFDAAHELGHLIMHQHISKEALNNLTLFNLVEEQAHRFAGAFLFPQRAFADEALVISLESLVVLKQRWKLSIGMMLKRAEHLEFITQEEARSLWRNYTRREWKKKEPLDDELPVEVPKLIKNAVELLVSQGVQSYSDIISYLNLYHDEIEELAGLPPNFLSEEKAPVIKLRVPAIRVEDRTDLPVGQADIIHFPRRNKSRYEN